jgi:hypothetical protein
MTKKLEKAMGILERRIRTLEARVAQINENYSFYHEIREELLAMKRIFDFVNNCSQKKNDA